MVGHLRVSKWLKPFKHKLRSSVKGQSSWDLEEPGSAAWTGSGGLEVVPECGWGEEKGKIQAWVRSFMDWNEKWEF